MYTILCSSGLKCKCKTSFCGNTGCNKWREWNGKSISYQRLITHVTQAYMQTFKLILPGLNFVAAYQMCPLLTSIDSTGDLLWSLVSKGLAALRADWMFNLLASKLRSEHTPHNGTHSSRWPLLSPRQLNGRQTDKELSCMCVPRLCRRKRYRKETKVLIWTSLRSHCPSRSLSLFVSLFLSLIYLFLSD